MRMNQHERLILFKLYLCDDLGRDSRELLEASEFIGEEALEET
jgi:hypothetical protein